MVPLWRSYGMEQVHYGCETSWSIFPDQFQRCQKMIQITTVVGEPDTRHLEWFTEIFVWFHECWQSLMVVCYHFDKFLRTLSTDRAFGQIHESHLGYHVEEGVFTYEVRNTLNLSLTKCLLINSRRYTMWLVLTRRAIKFRVWGAIPRKWPIYIYLFNLMIYYLQ